MFDINKLQMGSSYTASLHTKKVVLVSMYLAEFCLNEKLCDTEKKSRIQHFATIL